jgi:hypothetical protein
MIGYRLLGAIVVVAASLAMIVSGAAQEQYPLAATIRGENIWLLASPSDATDTSNWHRSRAIPGSRKKWFR